MSFIAWHALAGVRNNSLKKGTRYQGQKPRRPDLPRREDLETTSQLPIPYVPSAQQKPIAALVDQILKAKRADAHVDLAALEADLDLDIRAAALYGLSPTGVRIPPKSAPFSDRPSKRMA